MKKRVILISTTSWDKKVKEGSKTVFYILELEAVYHRIDPEGKYVTEFNYRVKTTSKQEDGTILLNEDGTVVGSMEAGMDVGNLDISALTTDVKTLGLTGTPADAQQKLTAHYFLTYANEVEDYGFNWVILPN